MNRFCVNCGHELKEGNRFCPNCGTESEPLVPSSSPTEFEVVSEIPSDSKRELSKGKKIVRIILYALAAVGSLMVLLIVIAILFGSSESPSNIDEDVSSSRVPLQHSPPTPIPIGYVDLREMLNLYEDNDVAAEHRYEGKRVVIDGIINEINREYFDIIPRGSDFFQMSGARCYYPSDRFNDALELREDQHITIRGAHDGFAFDLFLTIIEVMNCDF